MNRFKMKSKKVYVQKETSNTLNESALGKVLPETADSLTNVESVIDEIVTDEAVTDADTSPEGENKTDEEETSDDDDPDPQGDLIPLEEIELQPFAALEPEYTVIDTYYCYDRENKNLLTAYSSDGSLVKYVYGNGLLSPYEEITSNGITTTEYKNYTYDLRGSVTKTFNEAGVITSEHIYSTYGNRTTILGDNDSPIGYCGREGVLTETNGLIYMRARYYSVELMRFINEDIVLEISVIQTP